MKYLLVILIVAAVNIGHAIFCKIKGLYPVDLLEGENIVIKTKAHWAMMIPSGLFVLISIWHVSMIEEMPRMLLFALNSFASTVILVLVSSIAYLIVNVIRFCMAELTLTDMRVFGRCGFLSSMKFDLPIRSISHVLVSQGMIGGIFGFGKVYIYTPGARPFVFFGVIDPDKFKSASSDAIAHSRN